jgi:hypothetical protein
VIPGGGSNKLKMQAAVRLKRQADYFLVLQKGGIFVCTLILAPKFHYGFLTARIIRQ